MAKPRKETGLRSELRMVCSAHNLTAVRVLQIAEASSLAASQLCGVHGQEEVPGTSN